MFVKIAFKNLRAYKRRSIVTVLLTTVTTALLVFATAWMNGSHNKMIENAVEIYPGYLQITQADFRNSPSFDNLIFNATHVKEKLREIKGIKGFGQRFESFVLYSSGTKSIGGLFTAIEPSSEALLSRLKSSLKKGAFLADTDKNMVYMGIELAKKLKVNVGDQLSFIGTGADYSFAADNIIVKGLFQTGLFDFDANAAFVNLNYFHTVMGGENMATHFIVLPENKKTVEELAEIIGNNLGEEYQSATWQQTMASLVRAMEIDSIFGYITLGIIFIVIFFVIMIYTLLTVFARIREIGILRAIGTGPHQIFQLLLTESIILSLFSVIVGGVIGGALAYYFNLNPITFTGYEEQFKQYGLASSSMPTDFAPHIIIRDSIIMFILSVGSTIYPIVKVTKYNPIDAINHV